MARVQFEDFPLEIKKVILSFADDLDRFVFSLVNKNYAALYPFDVPITWSHINPPGNEEIPEDAIDPFPFKNEGLAVAAASYGYLPIVEMVAGERLSLATQRAAAGGGHVNVLQYILDLGFELSPVLPNFAAAKNQKYVIQWLASLDVRPSGRTLRAACRNGHFELLKWLRTEHKVEWDTNCLADACHNNDPTMVEWMINNGAHVSVVRCVGVAATEGHLELLRFLRALAERKYHGKMVEVDRISMNQAIKHGRLHLVEYLLSVSSVYTQDGEINLFDLVAEAYENRVQIAGILRAHRYPFAANSLHQACLSGHLDFVRWVSDNKLAPFAADHAISAAQTARLDVLKFLIEEKKVKASSQIMEAALSSYSSDETLLDTVRYLHQRGVKLTESTFETCLSGGHVACFYWLVNNGCPYSVERVATAAVGLNDPGLYMWALDKGYPIAPADVELLACSTNTSSSLALLEVSYDSGIALPSRAYSLALRNWSLPVMKWLFEHGCPVPPNFLASMVLDRVPVELCEKAYKAGAVLTSDLYCLARNSEMRAFLESHSCPIDGLKDTDDLFVQYRLRKALEKSRYTDDEYEEAVEFWKKKSEVRMPSQKLLMDLRDKWKLDGRLQGIIDELQTRRNDGEELLDDEDDKFNIAETLLTIRRFDDQFHDFDIEGLSESINDPRHPHPLKLTRCPYLNHPEFSGDAYNCNSCGEEGVFWSYHCKECEFDLHPIGCLVSTPALFNDPIHEHTLKLTQDAYGDYTGYYCDRCGCYGTRWSYHCEKCRFVIHPNCVEGDGKGEINLAELTPDEKAQEESEAMAALVNESGSEEGEEDVADDQEVFEDGEGPTEAPLDDVAENAFPDLNDQEGEEQGENQEDGSQEGDDSQDSYEEGYYSDHFDPADEDCAL